MCSVGRGSYGFTGGETLRRRKGSGEAGSRAKLVLRGERSLAGVNPLRSLAAPPTGLGLPRNEPGRRTSVRATIRPAPMRPLATALLLLALSGAIVAEWVSPTNWPVDRLVRNLTRHVEQHPDDASALYALGRIHSWAFVFQTDEVALLFYPGDPDAEEPELDVEQLANTLPSDALQRQRFAHPDASSNVSPKRTEHLTEAVRDLTRAAELDHERAETQLSLGSTLEAGAPFAASVDSPALLGWPTEIAESERGPIEQHIADLASEDRERAERARRELLLPAALERALPLLWTARKTASDPQAKRIAELLQHAWLERAAASYRHAFELTQDEDAGIETKPMKSPWSDDPLDSLVSYEAGQACVRLARGSTFAAFDQPFVARVENHLAALGRKPPARAITPVLLSLEGCPALPDLLAPDLVIPFDLDGDAVVEPWPWIAPSTGFLVWDPEQRGEVTSGQQLFGSASGWFFFPDGYRVLDALDDDGDGRLTGPELAGIAVWFDRDTDGVSDRGEVLAVEDLGIVALATEPTERIGASLGNPCGFELADGRVLPTYDWVLERVAP